MKKYKFIILSVPITTKSLLSDYHVTTKLLSSDYHVSIMPYLNRPKIGKKIDFDDVGQLRLCDLVNAEEGRE